MFVKKVFWMFF